MWSASASFMACSRSVASWPTESSGLVAGQTYEYRITGHFNAADLSDTIFDVQPVPSQTVLPATFRIGDLALTFPAPVPVVLEPAPADHPAAPAWQFVSFVPASTPEAISVLSQGELVEAGTPSQPW